MSEFGRRKAGPSREHIARAVEALIKAQTWGEDKRIIEAERETLLTKAADQYLADLLELNSDNADVISVLQVYRDLLRRCRREGVERAFADYLQNELQMLLREILQITNQSEMSHRVDLCRAALQLVNRNEQPQIWATLRGLLAESLAQDPQGERANNLELAIYHYQQALDVNMRQANPAGWAEIQGNLGNALRERIRGERADNLEQAIHHYQQGLEVYTKQAYPRDWATMHNNLGGTYIDRIRGERAENLEQAIHHLEQALEVRTRQAYPREWARTQHNLALAYRERIRGERAEYLEQAISHFQQALEVSTRQAYPEDWARTQNGLGSAFNARIRGERAENLEQAILHHEQALEVSTRQAYPEDWARSQGNLALAYRERIRGERAENLEQAISHFQQALEVYTRQAYPEEWARSQDHLGIVYRERIRGERAENLEQAILHHEQALEVSTRQAYPEDWAGAQINLGRAFSERIRGERAENLEQAISHFQQALEVSTRQAYPEDWARTQNGLGNTFRERIRDERAENLEQAISHFQQALEVYTRQAYPEEWASVQNNLGSAFRARIRGERAENLEQAISHFQQALEVRTRQAFPEEWATAQSSLGNAFSERIRGERAENLEQAISHFQQALEVRTRQAFPEGWARSQGNLALAYRERIRGERAENLEQAISHFQQALEVYTRQAYPEDWARTQNGLGNAFSERIRGEQAENLEQAILHHEQALEVYTRQAFPERWAGAQINLGNGYFERIRSERAENLEQAILHYQQALEVYTRQAFPEEWAVAQNNLGNAFRARIRGERAENLEQAILHYQQALEVYTPITFPQECRNTAYALGRLLYDERHFSEARHVLGTAHQAIEALRSEVQRDVAKRSLAEENADLYARLVSCCLQVEDEAAAFAYAVTGKGRAFVDLLATARLDLSAASVNDPALADDLRIARELRQQIDNLLAALTGESGPSTSGSSKTTGLETPSHMLLPPEVLHTQLSALQAQVANHWDEMAYKYPALTATQKAPILSVDQACELASELNAMLVEYYRHAEGWCAFVVTPNAMHHIPLPLLDDDLLEHMVNWMLRLEYPVGRNLLSYTLLSEWYNAVIAPLETYLPQKQPVVLAPFGDLHVLPLAAARHPQTGRYVAEDYQIAFAPSLSALHTMWEQVHSTLRDRQAVPHRLLIVAYAGAPGSDHYLPNVLPEAQAIASHFTQVTKLYEDDATPEAVLAQGHDQNVVHFGCHGWFDAEQPEESGLMLAGGWLTVQRIITELSLQHARLVTLGACLSGRAALQRGDEHVGLLQAMLTTGAKAVLASLWPVDDAATRTLFETFYAELIAGRSPANAMQEAARSVRARLGWEHPYYWAAFQVSGLAHSSHEPEPVPLPTT